MVWDVLAAIFMARVRGNAKARPVPLDEKGGAPSPRRPLEPRARAVASPRSVAPPAAPVVDHTMSNFWMTQALLSEQCHEHRGSRPEPPEFQSGGGGDFGGGGATSTWEPASSPSTYEPSPASDSGSWSSDSSSSSFSAD